MTALEVRASLGLAGILGLRMLGMFLILPVFALYAEQLPGGNDHVLIGAALGAYGVTQALLHIPFGALSDRWGRKRTIYVGLLIFAIGSFIAAAAQDIHMVILGRIIQGAGAISAALIALTADLTRDEQRTKAMAIIGMTIGFAFALSMVAGPPLGRFIGVPGIFALTGLLALLGLAVVRWIVPAVPMAKIEHQPSGAFAAMLCDAQLARLNFGVFALFAVLMAAFVVVPFQLRSAGLAAASHWQVYLPVMLGALLLMVPPMLVAERRGQQKLAFLAAIAALVAGEIGLLLYGESILGISVSLLVFFTGFNLLEASLPSLLSRMAPPASKGTALGIFSTAQSLGAAAGAVAGGLLSQHWGAPWVFAACVVVTLLWFGVAASMRVPPRAGTRTYPVPRLDPQRAAGLSQRLADLPGVREAMVIAHEGVARLKVDSARFDEQRVLALIAGET